MGKGLCCPVCGEHEFDEPDFYEVCPKCGWADDPVQRDDPEYRGGANAISLSEYKAKWELQEIA